MTDILSIADNIFQYVNNVYMKEEDNPTTTKDIMKELINMEQTNKTGGVAIDDVMNNFTGGNVVEELNKTTKKKHIFDPVVKQLDQNLFEGGNNEDANESNNENVVESKNEDANESNNENVVESLHKDEDNSSHDNEYDSDDEEEEMIKKDIIVYNEDKFSHEDNEDEIEYENYLKQLDDEDIPQQKNMKGGNNEKSLHDNGFETLSMFPYFIKY